ncbi:MAG: phospholipase D-like domain-containing protein [Thermoplasmatales archaeon]
MEFFSFRGEHLSYLIPTIYLLTPEKEKVYIISPWLNASVLLFKSWEYPTKKVSLLELCLEERIRGVDTEIFTSDMSNDDEYTQGSLEQFKKDGFKVSVMKELHIKAVLGYNLLYLGSANITYNGIYRNRENVTIRTVGGTQKEVLSRLLT